MTAEGVTLHFEGVPQSAAYHLALGVRRLLREHNIVANYKLRVEAEG